LVRHALLWCRHVILSPPGRLPESLEDIKFLRAVECLHDHLEETQAWHV
jgi:hypothetical protein